MPIIIWHSIIGRRGRQSWAIYQKSGRKKKSAKTESQGTVWFIRERKREMWIYKVGIESLGPNLILQMEDSGNKLKLASIKIKQLGFMQVETIRA